MFFILRLLDCFMFNIFLLFVEVSINYGGAISIGCSYFFNCINYVLTLAGFMGTVKTLCMKLRVCDCG